MRETFFPFEFRFINTLNIYMISLSNVNGGEYCRFRTILVFSTIASNSPTFKFHVLTKCQLDPVKKTVNF